MKEAAAKVQMYVGVRQDAKGFTEMEYNPHELVVIFRDHAGTEIRLDPKSMSRMEAELTRFVTLLEHIGVQTK